MPFEPLVGTRHMVLKPGKWSLDTCVLPQRAIVPTIGTKGEGTLVARLSTPSSSIPVSKCIYGWRVVHPS